MSDVPSGCAVRAGAYFAAKPKALAPSRQAMREVPQAEA
jgi:hypothetical protein